MHRCLIDTCVWIALIIESDVHHKKAVSVFLSLQKKQILVNTQIIAEVGTVLIRLGRKDYRKLFRSLLHDMHVRIISGHIPDYMDFFDEIDNKKLSFQDCCLLMDALYEELDLITFDTELMNSYIEQRTSFVRL